MEEKILHTIENIEELYKTYIKTCDFFAGTEKKIVEENYSLIINNIDTLYRIYEVIKEETYPKKIFGKHFYAEVSKEESIVHFGESEIKLNRKNLIEWIQVTIDLNEHTLPMGSVVELKQELLSQVFHIKEEQPLYVVIIERFLICKSGKMYLPYAGYFYPVGRGNPPIVIHFNSKMYNRILHIGYEDAAEYSYVCQEKKRLIIENKMHSVAFADKEELEQFRLELEELR